MTNKLEIFTPIVRETVGYSRDLAVEFKSKIITPVFFLLAMTYIQDSDAYNALNDCDIIASKLRPLLEKTTFSELEPPDTRHPLDSLPYLSDETKKVLELGVVSAREHGVQTITSASFLIGLMRYESNDIDKILAHFDVQRKDIIKAAEYHAKKDGTLEKLIKIESTGYLAQILNAFGLQQGSKMDRFTPVARRMLSVSQELAQEFKSKFITPEFMFLALTYLEGSDGYDALNDCDIIASKLRPFLEKTMFSELEPPDTNHLLLSDSTKKVLELSVGSAREQGLFFIGTASLVVGIMRLESENMDTILAHFDVRRQDVIDQAEIYALKDDNFEKQSSHEYLAQKDADPIGCFATIRNMLGLTNDDKKDTE